MNNHMIMPKSDGITLSEAIKACGRYWYVLAGAVVLSLGGAFAVSQLSPTTYTSTVTSLVHGNGVSPEVASKAQADFSASVSDDNNGSVIIRSIARTPDEATKNTAAALDFLSSLPAVSDGERPVYQDNLATLKARRATVRGLYGNGGGEAPADAAVLAGFFQLDDQVTHRIRDIERALAASSFVVPDTVGSSLISSSPPLRNALLAGLLVGLLIGAVAAVLLDTRRKPISA